MAHLAHEFKSPLMVMGGLARSLSRNESLPQDAFRKLEIIYDECQRLERLVRDVLGLAAPVRQDSAGADVLEMVRETMEVLGHQQSGSVRLVLVPLTRAKVNASRDAVRVCLQNLMGNGLDAMRRSGTLLVKVEEKSGYAEIQVCDEGEGMSSQALEQAFEPFHTTKPGGTGLGLPLVCKLVKAAGGSVALDSQPDKGTIATLRLPLLETDNAQLRPSG